jgi:hypothetical protein
MAAIAAHVTTKVLPDVPVRQWVLAAPWELRRLLARNAVVLSAIVQIFIRTVMGHYRRAVSREDFAESSAGAISFVQYFGGSLNAHPHVHVVFTDGSFVKTAQGNVVFVPASTPSALEIARVASEVASKVVRWLLRRGFIGEHRDEDEDGAPAQPETAVDACVQAALQAGTFAKLTGQQPTHSSREQKEDVRFDHRKRSPWAAEIDGFSVHAGVHIQAGDAKGREILLRYCARPALSLERLSVLADGRIAYQTKYPGRGGKTHRLMTPIEFLARLSALIPPPRRPSFRYHGAFAPAARWRNLVAPAAVIAPGQADPSDPCRNRAPATSRSGDCRAPSAADRSRQQKSSARDGRAGREALRPSLTARPLSRDARPGRRSTSYIDWPSLRLRTHDIDVLRCPTCDGRMQIVAAVTEHRVVESILSHLRLPLAPQILADGHTVAYDIKGQPLIDVSVEQDDVRWQRGPPVE